MQKTKEQEDNEKIQFQINDDLSKIHSFFMPVIKDFNCEQSLNYPIKGTYKEVEHFTEIMQNQQLKQ